MLYLHGGQSAQALRGIAHRVGLFFTPPRPSPRPHPRPHPHQRPRPLLRRPHATAGDDTPRRDTSSLPVLNASYDDDFSNPSGDDADGLRRLADYLQRSPWDALALAPRAALGALSDLESTTKRLSVVTQSVQDLLNDPRPIADKPQVRVRRTLFSRMTRCESE